MADRSYLTFAAIALGASSCMGIAGLDGDYVLGEPAGPGGSAGTGGTANGGGGTNPGGSSSGGSTTAGGGGTGGSAGPEDCLNGVDDNDNGAIDCDDPACQPDFGCVPAEPTALSYLTLVGVDADCAAPTAKTELQSCSGCSCADDPGTCSVRVDGYWDAACNAYAASEWGPVCVNIPDGNHAFIATSSHDDNASCGAISASTGSTTQATCTLTSAGTCTGSEACVPSAIAAQACILLDGDVSCLGSYTARRVFFEGATTPCDCTCTAGNPGCEAANLEISHSGDNCPENDPRAIDGNCQDAGYVTSMRIPAVAGSQSCESSGTPQGGGPTRTLCCLP